MTGPEHRTGRARLTALVLLAAPGLLAPAMAHATPGTHGKLRPRDVVSARESLVAGRLSIVSAVYDLETGEVIRLP